MASEDQIPLLDTLPTPYDREWEETFIINLWRTAQVLETRLAILLKPAQLTPTQFHLLRILRLAEDLLNCSDLSARMIAKDTDITRLLDRLEKRGLIVRCVPSDNLRCTFAWLTEAGVELHDSVEERVTAFYRQQVSRFGRGAARDWNRRLEDMAR